MHERVLGIDVGGTTVKWVVLDALTTTVLVRGAVPTAADPHAVAADLAALVVRAEYLADDVAGGDARIGAIGVGVPGHVDRRTGVVRFLPNVPGGWPGFPLAGTLRAATGRPVTVLNDARAFCQAEWRLGAARGHDDVLFLTLGTGVGGGVVSGGRLLTGPDDRLGEIGHLVYDRRGPACGCGHRGCLETFASATAIARAAGRATAEDAFLAPGDLDARMAVATAGRAIGETVASLCAVLPAGLLVVGGGVAAGLPRLRPYIEIALAERRDFIGVVDVVAAGLGPDAGAVGAALAALDVRDSTTTDGGGRELDQASA
ncbi:ROK family protein [Jiangella alkaliphila]|uniref:Glucokinase n=1 Tax=Jiangella alkaliphila TaxID=419479 RepID=A0A1H2LA37_9ACTN|nr:ROK family protein [Jiangella alkaliphila]SDU77585.1 glucokinase [Jiangella alkaliphila]